MACHVFRKIRLGVYKEVTTLQTINIEAKGGLTNPISALVFGRNPGKTRISTDFGMNNTGQDNTNISITEEKELECSKVEGGGLATMV